MNKTNPLFILLVSFIIVLMSVFFLIQEKANIKNAEIEYNDFKIIALKYQDKQNSYHDANKIIKSLESIIKKSNVKNVNITQEKTKIVLIIQKSNTRILDNLMNKILNHKFNIKKLELTNNSLRIEVGLV